MLKHVLMSAGLMLVACSQADRPAPAGTGDVTQLDLDLYPHFDARANAFTRLDVRLAFHDFAAEAGEPVLRIPLVTNNVDTVATVLSDLVMNDASGPVPLSVADVEAGTVREWRAERAVRGPVTVRYTVPADASLPPRGPAPPYEFSNDGLGMSAAGHVFLLLPPGETRYDTRLVWHLSDAPVGAVGVSSLGGGEVLSTEPLSRDELRRGFFMAGAIQTWPDPLPEGGFFGALQGNPPFDGQALLAWTGELYGHYEGFFDQDGAPPYGVFLRENPVNAGGGVGLHRSFVTTFGQERGSDPDAIKLTLAHEMFHTFQPVLSEPAGLESSWFSEGLATFYQSRLPLRYGMITPDQALANINFHAGRYYSSLMAQAPNSLVPQRFWADTRVRTLPYDRGMLYFATIDHAVRTRSGGARSLDDLMLAMLEMSGEAGGASNADWEALLETELGEQAVTEFRAFLDGDMPVPESEAFGPCFARTRRDLRRYELGFDTEVLAEPVRIVRGLVPGSAADQAGLRNGDLIIDPVPQDHLQGTQDMMLTLSIGRGDDVFEITYLPRGETVAAYQWERVEGTPDRDCAL
ncbi:hypothetical protein [Maricaulis parjimensis]|uniref:hypothetical protein n=1 Tax=Maricaulis parjimensis TaxID=144023 RepID=UPI00193A424B|nr:hypothetical protein [Maricaulis parjimensis]